MEQRERHQMGVGDGKLGGGKSQQLSPTSLYEWAPPLIYYQICPYRVHSTQ